MSPGHAFTLCQSVLGPRCRDVFGHYLPAGRWRFRVTASGGTMRLQVRQQDSLRARWRPLADCHHEHTLTGDFEIRQASEVKFIFSGPADDADSDPGDIAYKCVLSSAAKY